MNAYSIQLDRISVTMAQFYCEQIHRSDSDGSSVECVQDDVDPAGLCVHLRAFHESLVFAGTEDLGLVEDADISDHALACMLQAGLPLAIMKIVMRIRHVVLVRQWY